MKPERRKLVIDSTKKAMVASNRMSTLCPNLPSNGANRIGRKPNGAVARPAQIAV
ncbi:hypothetical protein D3C71_2250930 [compost metagenome]